MALLRVSGLSKIEAGNTTVSDISFTQTVLQKIAIAGETGSGKTTLLQLIAGLQQPTAGDILFEGKKVRGPNDQLIPGHAGIAYLSQHFELRNNYWVHEILSYANHRPEEEAMNLYSICRIDHLLQRRTNQLSGGERQRIALARLLVGAPRLLLLDEPFSNLDASHRQIIQSVLHDINTRLKISCIMVSHDAPDILPWADTVLVLQAGQLLQTGTPLNVYHAPVNAYCAGLLGEYNIVQAPLAAALQSVNDDSPPAHNRKQWLVRPEAFLLGTTTNGLPAVIKAVDFMGAYYRLTLHAAAQDLLVYTRAGYSTGETVSLSLPLGSGSYID
ncbi:MAG TPA: ABC transporter ATP-binding protein [Chitinophagaceae bacterium]|nr:ABC transporter ATP-binding protein [Chitinophagaceae bacterium]